MTWHPGLYDSVALVGFLVTVPKNGEVGVTSLYELNLSVPVVWSWLPEPPPLRVHGVFVSELVAVYDTSISLGEKALFALNEAVFSVPEAKVNVTPPVGLNA